MVAAVLAVTAASVYGFVWSAGKARTEATKEMTLQAQRAASSISASLAAAKQTVAGLTAQPGLDKLFASRGGECTLSAQGSGAFLSVRLDIVGPDGRVACSSRPSRAVGSPAVHAGSDWLHDVLRSPETVVDWTAIDAATQKPAVVVTAQVRHAGHSVGAVALFLHVPQAATALAHDFAGTEHASFTLVDRAAHVVTSASETHRGRPEARFQDSRTEGDWAGVDGSRRLFGSAAVAGSDWRVYAGVRRSAVLASARGALTRQALVGFLALLVLAVAVWILNRRIAGPLRSVIEAVVRASREPDGTRVGEVGTAELVALAHEFNAMLDVRAGHEAQLAHQATHDPLTGLPNKILLRERLDHALRGDTNGAGVAVLCLGLNRLDVVNDGFGHDAADRVLVQVSARLSTALHPGETLARFGCEEFVLLCEDVRGEDAVHVAQRLRRCLEQPFRGPDSDIVVQASIGIALASDDARSSDQLLREADSAMREAKSTGRSWCRFDHGLQLRATQHLAVEHALWQALQREEFVVHYQPLLGVVTGTIVGTEALVRWHHPERGLVPPIEFIPTAEETGQIAAIGRFVLARACQQAADWAAAGHPIRMSVNVAVDQLRDDDFPAIVQEVLSETGLAAEQLCLEITESSLMREAAHGSIELARLKRLGVRLAIDDFGTGYSSLSYLHDLPVDEIKIDRSFISRLDRDVRDEHLVEAIMRMARALGLAVVAEGVETERQLQSLVRLDCGLAQGYLFAPAQPADRLLSLLEAQRAQEPLALAV